MGAAVLRNHFLCNYLLQSFVWSAMVIRACHMVSVASLTTNWYTYCSWNTRSVQTAACCCDLAQMMTNEGPSEHALRVYIPNRIVPLSDLFPLSSMQWTRCLIFYVYGSSVFASTSHNSLDKAPTVASEFVHLRVLNDKWRCRNRSASHCWHSN